MAYSFDGSNDYISPGDVLDRDWDDPWSIAYWIKAGSQAGNKFVVCKQQSSGIFRGYGTYMLGSHKISAFTQGDNINYGSNLTYMVGSTNVNTNQWTHVVATKNNASNTDSFNIFINGVAETLSVGIGGSHTTTTISDANFSIGSRNNAQLYFAGNLAEVGTWDVELSAAEAVSLYKGMSCEKVRPQNLQFYAPLVRDVIDAKGYSLSNNGATVADHPRIYG